MKQKFSNINEFISSRPKCAFCGSQLVPALSNFFKLPRFNSKVKGGAFVFDLKYISATQYIDAIGNLDIHSNELKFDIHPTKNNSDVSYEDVVSVFTSLCPHVQLFCNDKKCKMNYYCCSNFFLCEKDNDLFKIKPFLSYYEACKVSKYFVQTDHIYNTTRIITNSGSTIMTEPINFSSFDKDRLKSRVLTIVTFN